MTPPARIAWVTGGGRGIGRACALALARDGFAVAVTARSPSELREAVQTCTKLGVDALAAPADVTKPAAVRSAYLKIRKRLGAPLVLVNGAGIAHSAPFLKTTGALMEEHWRLNVLGTFHCIQAALPAMLDAGWGRVVNVASVAGKVGAPYISAYAASKHAVLGLTRTLAAEFGSRGVTANAVCPGYVDTRMTDENLRVIATRTGMSVAKARAHVKGLNPQNRLIQPEEVAAAVAHFCRNESGGINGQALTIDGGALQW